MKKVIIFVFAISLVLCGCKAKPDTVSSSPSGTENVTSEVSKPQESQPEEPATTEESSVPTVSVVESKPVETTSKITVKEPEISLGYTVNDPDNARMLSTERKGYSFGVARDGAPHSISVNNQLYFDGLSDVKALALDTKSSQKRLYLTFDCGYEYQGITGDILDVLLQYNVKAAFFCTLEYIKDNPQFVSRMINEGHIVGNHSATHPSFPNLTRTQMANEIYRVDATLQENFNYHSPYFRFPEGAYSECALDLVTSVGFRSIFWSVAYADWDTSKQLGTQNAFDTVTSRLHPGAVILLHAVSIDNANALPSIIEYAVNNGYTFCSLDEYLW